MFQARPLRLDLREDLGLAGETMPQGWPGAGQSSRGEGSLGGRYCAADFSA